MGPRPLSELTPTRLESSAQHRQRSLRIASERVGRLLERASESCGNEHNGAHYRTDHHDAYHFHTLPRYRPARLAGSMPRDSYCVTRFARPMETSSATYNTA